MVALAMAASTAHSLRVVPKRGASSLSARRRGAVVIRASADDGSGSQTTTSGAEDTTRTWSSYDRNDPYIPTTPPPRESPFERVVKDPFTAAIMAPRVALGGLDLLSKGELFSLAAGAPGEVSALLNDPRPIQDKAVDAFKKAEEMVEMLEKRGVAAEAPGRELVRPAIPADLYEKYLDPAALEPAPVAQRPYTSEYTAEPSSYTTTREVEIPYSPESFAPVSTTSASPTYAFDDAEDAAVAAAVAAVAAALGEDDEEEEEDADTAETSGSGSSDEVEDVTEQASTSASATGTNTNTNSERAAFDSPAPPADAWSAAKEAESFAAEFVMSQSAAIASKEAK